MGDNFEEIVGSLTATTQEGLFVQKRDSRIRALSVFAARNISNSLEALLVQTKPALLATLEEWPKSEGFDVVLRPVKGKVGDATLVCLELTSPRYRDVFMSLAEDICKVVSVETDAQSALQKMHRRLYRWQEFLKRHREEGLSPEQRVGLFGELEILQEVFLKTLEPVHAIQGWRGCKKAHQDFQYQGFALEVKATRAVTPDRIHISNIQQLDEEGVDEMFLSLVWLHQNESSGRSLPAIIAEIRSTLSDPAETLFNEGLMEVGYLDIHQSIYEKELYQVRKITVFLVGEGFPRLTHSMIPDGIKGVKYQISIDACGPFLVEEDAFQSSVHNLKGRLENG